MADDYKTITRPSAINMKKFNRVALVIGNDKYDVAPLSNAVADASAMKNFLETENFKVIYVNNADEQTMKSKVTEFLALLNSKSIGFIYYSGHGIQEYSRNERRTVNYLIPINNKQFKSLTDLDYHALSLNYILDSLSEKQNGLNIVLLDACRTPFKSFTKKSQIGLAPSNATGVYIAYATASGDKALDNGLFRKSFIKHAKESLKLVDIFEKVKRDVYNKTHQILFTSNGKIGSFYFKKSIKIDSQELEVCKYLSLQSYEKTKLFAKKAIVACKKIHSVIGEGYITKVLHNIDKKNKANMKFNKIKSKLENKCLNNDKDACFILGINYVENNNTKKALPFLSKACVLNHKHACFEEGLRLTVDESIDKIKGVKSLKKGCNLQDSPSCFLLGILYEHAHAVVPFDKKKALFFYQRACDIDGGGCVVLGKFYNEGKYVKKDKNKAKKLYLRACNLNDGEGCAYYSIEYLATNRKKAISLLEKACSLDYLGGCVVGAEMYKLESEKEKDYSSKERKTFKRKSKKLYKKACDSGYEKACNE